MVVRLRPYFLVVRVTREKYKPDGAEDRAVRTSVLRHPRNTNHPKRQIVERRYKLHTCLLIDVALLRALCAVWSAGFLSFGKTYRLYRQGCASVHIPENEDGMPLRNVGNKLPNHTAQQSRRSGSSRLKRRKPQSAVRLLLRVYVSLIILSSHLLCLLAA